MRERGESILSARTVDDKQIKTWHLWFKRKLSFYFKKKVFGVYLFMGDSVIPNNICFDALKEIMKSWIFVLEENKFLFKKC